MVVIFYLSKSWESTARKISLVLIIFCVCIFCPLYTVHRVSHKYRRVGVGVFESIHRESMVGSMTGGGGGQLSVMGEHALMGEFQKIYGEGGAPPPILPIPPSPLRQTLAHSGQLIFIMLTLQHGSNSLCFHEPVSL